MRFSIFLSSDANVGLTSLYFDFKRYRSLPSSFARERCCVQHCPTNGNRPVQYKTNVSKNRTRISADMVINTIQTNTALEQYTTITIITKLHRVRTNIGILL